MISRRRFLEVGGATAGMTVASPFLGGAAPQCDDSLPASLGQLKSRKSEAAPITREERQQRGVERSNPSIHFGPSRNPTNSDY